jgi:hypothetical protein
MLKYGLIKLRNYGNKNSIKFMLTTFGKINELQEKLDSNDLK